MKRSIWFTALFLLAPLCGAAETVYKWTDDNGVVHFSKSPPSQGTAQKMSLESAPVVAAEPAAPAATPDGDLYAEAEQPDNSGVEAENRAKRCSKGQAMIAQIEPRPRVFRVAEDGSKTYLDDDERLKLLDEARQLVEQNCDQ